MTVNVRRLHRLIAEHYRVIDAVRHNWINVGGRNRGRHICNTVHQGRRYGWALIDADPKCLHGAYTTPETTKGYRQEAL